MVKSENVLSVRREVNAFSRLTYDSVRDSAKSLMHTYRKMRRNELASSFLGMQLPYIDFQNEFTVNETHFD